MKTLSSANPDADRIANRLKLYFAILSCLGGLALSSSAETQSLPVVAIFFAVFGYLFVDWLELFSLPPIAAYASMGLAALYCISDFADLNSHGSHQMVAVAQLLVLVQAILMLQRKSQRIFEQLGVFCMLQLIVAAIFNNAINYGILLIPIAVVGVWALSLLAALSASEGIGWNTGLDGAEDAFISHSAPTPKALIQVSAPESAASLAREALRLPRIALLTLTPAVFLVGCAFFYAIPRTTDAARITNSGSALVGFSDTLRLEQIGQMMKSSAIAVRVQMTDRTTGLPYESVRDLYLRGRVLELYGAPSDRQVASWSALTLGPISGSQKLPPEYFPRRSTDSNFYDTLQVNATCEATRSNALFAVAPYHRESGQGEIVHHFDRWTIARRDSSELIFPRTSYSFGTHAFRNGVQVDLIARHALSESALLPSAQNVDGTPMNSRALESYQQVLLEFDEDRMPSVARIAERFVTAPKRNGGVQPNQRRSDFEYAKSLESYLSKSVDFSYTLNLDATPILGMDPIEQFLAVDRRGHCQYFASALVMMLRSQKIPARIVVGYRTDEYNELSQRYIARQLHAHAWVEALIDADQLDPNNTIYGQPPAAQYWLRLDPTPSENRASNDTGGVSKVFDLAQNFWDDKVVDMNGGNQSNLLPGTGAMHDSYGRFVQRLALMIDRVRAGELGGGSLAGRNLFSLPAALMAIGIVLFVAITLRYRRPFRSRRHDTDSTNVVRSPSIAFYSETLHQLSRVGVNRESWQTPSELVGDAVDRLQHPSVPSIAAPLDLLTSTFYWLKFGGGKLGGGAVHGNSDRDSSILERSRSIGHALEPEAIGTRDNSKHDVDQALAELTRRVDLLTKTKGAGESL